MSRQEYSIVEFFGADEGHDCGYCKQKDCSRSDGMWAHSLTVRDYQDLIDRGWRRSGLYCYKPIMNATCCPQYTIRCAVRDFQLSKSQKKVLKKMTRALVEGVQRQQPSQGADDAACLEMPDMPDTKVATSAEQVCVTSGVGNAKTAASTSTTPGADDAACTYTPNTKVAKQVCVTSGVGNAKTPRLDAAKPCRKARVVRRERWMEKLRSQGIDPASVERKRAPPPISVEEMLALPPQARHRLELRLVQSCPPSEQFLQSQEQSFQVYFKYQVHVHKDSPDKITMKQFLKFLVKSPLVAEEVGGLKFGSFHQQYWLDGELIAVGVLDVLPHCVSSVYFYYDPGWAHLSLGTYAALREVALTRELRLPYYYMGFYIHSCAKMRYKGLFTPSYLACPRDYSWHRIESCRPQLDCSKYCVFSQPGSPRQTVDLADVLVLHRRTAMSFAAYAARKGEVQRQEVLHYAELVGGPCASRMLLYRE